MKKNIIIISSLLWIIAASESIAQTVSPALAEKAASTWISNTVLHENYQFEGIRNLKNEAGEILAYCFDLYPEGYLILTADQSLPPVVAYSFTSNFSMLSHQANPLNDMLLRDLKARLTYLPNIEDQIKDINRGQWNALIEGITQKRSFEQWPPPGSTSTGGWLETNWSQSAPYNNFCPLDEITSQRSVAAQQVYTSSVSGTFGVDQAYDAYLRFGYADAVLVYDSDTSFYTHMKHNMIDGMPVHLAVLSSTGSGGHNVVTDGYNTDEYYHLNFGWGGSYNGWYLLPEEIPYNLTIIEGAVMDIGVTHVGINKNTLEDKARLTVYPNPSAGPVNIRLELPEPGNVQLEVRNIRGRLVQEIYSGPMDKGVHCIVWQADANTGSYYITMSNGEIKQTKKLIIY